MSFDEIRERVGAEPISMGLILGSGLGALADEVDGVAIPFEDIPGLGASGVTGHSGKMVVGSFEGKRVAILSGRKHYYEDGNAAAMRPALECLKALGAETLVLTNSAGSTREEMPPGSLMQITDHLNWSGLNPLIGEPGDERFVSMTAAYPLPLQLKMQAAAEAEGISLHRGVYAWFSGPSFETPAEINAIRILGADAVGMSTVPENILAQRLGLKVAAVSLITNFAAGMTGADLSHDETKSEADKAKPQFSQLIRAFVRAT